MEDAHTTAPGPKAPHVSDDLVRDVDSYDLIAGDEDAQIAWRRLVDAMPSVFWPQRNGGLGIVTEAPAISAIELDHERFSQPETVVPPSAADLPFHDPHGPAGSGRAPRGPIMPAFLSRAVTAFEDKARNVARSWPGAR